MSRRRTKRHILEAIKGSGGITSTVAKKLGVDWSTARSDIAKYEETKAAFEAESEIILDMAESTVFKSIKGGDTQDAKWLLSRKGRDRGYIERQEVESSGEITVRKVIADAGDSPQE